MTTRLAIPIGPAPAPDTELVAACVRGIAQAERHLFERYGPITLTICRRYADDRMEAEDFHQLSWIRIFERLDLYQGKGSLEGWLRRLTVNCCLVQIRARRRRERWQTTLPEDENLVPIHWEELDFIAEERLMDFIAALPEGARLVFNLFAVEGYDHGQIAEALSISEANSRQQLLRARQLLAKRIGRHPISSNKF